jgi:Zn-dependent protease with chaperone function
LPARSDTAPQGDRHRIVFRLQLTLGLSGLVVAGAAVGTAAETVHRESRGAHAIVIAGQHFTYPTVNVAAAVLLGLAALGAAVMATAARASLRQLRLYRRFVRGIAVVGPLPGHPGVIVIEDPTPQAFCAGYLQPRVYISRGALDLLSEEELGAVLFHEDHHRAVRDPLRFACARVLSQALFFLPALRPLGDRYGDLAERNADAAAVEASAGEKGPLASALIAFEGAAPQGAAGISPERVDSLLGQPARRRLPSFLIAMSLASLSGLVVLVWRASEAASAQATFNLPVISSQPCMLVLALLPLLACIAALGWRRRLAQSGRPGLVLAGS